MKLEYIKEVVKHGTSNYVLVPKNVIKALKLSEKDIVKISIEKVKGEWYNDQSTVIKKLWRSKKEKV